MAVNESSSSIKLSSNSIADLVSTSNQDIEMIQIVNKWVDVFQENPRIGTIKLLAVLVDCLDIEVCTSDITNFNSDEMYMKITNCLNTLNTNGRLHSAETIKKLPSVIKTLQFLNSIFSQHSSLFLSSTECKNYFIFLRDIFVRMSQSMFPGPRLLATYFGLKIITGLMQSESTVLINGLVIELLEEFMFKRWKDSSYVIREAVLSELEIWLQINPSFFINQFWKHIYYALCDKSCCVQNIALKICKYLFTYHYNDLDVKRLIQKLLSVLTNLLLSKNEDVAISALKAYSILDSDDTEEYSSTIESIALELIFSENSNIACYAGQHFFEHFVNTEPNRKDRLKFLVTFLSGVPQHLSAIAKIFFSDAIYEICPDLKDYKLIAKVLSTENFLDQNEKCILATLLMYIVKREITGVGSELKTANMGFVMDISENHINKVEKREFTASMLSCLLNEMKNCELHTYAFSLLVLMQFVDYKLDKTAIPIILEQLSIFYNTYDVPTLLEMVSRNIYSISLCFKPLEYNFCLEHIKNTARVNVEVIKSGTIMHHQENSALPSLLCQKLALIRIWSLAKYNQIPEELNTLLYLSYYIPNLKDSQNNLVVSKFAFYAYFEILKNKLRTESDIEDDAAKFIECMFGVMKTYDAQVFELCESSFIIVEQFLRIQNSIQKPYELDSNQNHILTAFMFNVSKNDESDDDVNTIKLLEIYVGLIQDELIDISHLITLLQFIQMDIFEQALRPVFNMFCTRETGNKLCNIIDIFLVYMFENITSESENFEDIKFKDVIEIASIIARLINQCNDKIGKRLVSTYVHRHGIQYAMDDTLDYPFKQFFWVLCSMCNSLSPYDAEQLANYLIDDPKIKELINIGNVHALTYLYRLQERYDKNLNSSRTE
ncbi:uncharacterized protein LOC126841710 isoform X1 [Adelges cooleyi]|uniref:uncharacterized protein LOC126841710 isoform X1 n=2 Tax=Adelges cooleyi TaxID=133065 RepID=UPI0021807255|nr:uncharacterized protein LOC126841710 isoform X1 [Adelges cooleyi]